MRVFRTVLIISGVLILVLAFFRLNVRQIDGTGLCGSIVQGSTHDDGGSRTAACNQLRHHDTVAAGAFVIIGVAELGFGVGHTFYARNR